MQPGRKRNKVLEGLDRQKRYSVEDACSLVESTAFAKFEESVDLAVRLGVNPRHADQMVRGAIVLPHGVGKTKRVLVFAKAERSLEPLERLRRHLPALLAAVAGPVAPSARPRARARR